jgi:hypothetical protein
MIPQAMLQRRKIGLFGRSLQFGGSTLAVGLNNGLNSMGKLPFIAQDGVLVRKIVAAMVDSQRSRRGTRILR